MKFEDWQTILSNAGCEINVFDGFAQAMYHDDVISEIELSDPYSGFNEDNPDVANVTFWPESSFFQNGIGTFTWTGWRSAIKIVTVSELENSLKHALENYNTSLKEMKRNKILSICKDEIDEV